MEGWRSWQNGTLGGIAERDQVCLVGLPSPSSRIYIHTQPLPHLRLPAALSSADVAGQSRAPSQRALTLVLLPGSPQASLFF